MYIFVEWKHTYHTDYENCYDLFFGQWSISHIMIISEKHLQQVHAFIMFDGEKSGSLSSIITIFISAWIIWISWIPNIVFSVKRYSSVGRSFQCLFYYIPLWKKKLGQCYFVFLVKTVFVTNKDRESGFRKAFWNCSRTNVFHAADIHINALVWLILFSVVITLLALNIY